MKKSKIHTVTNTKGGVGKTTLTANLGALLADAGQRVLLVDADVQPSLSGYFPLAERAPLGLSELATGVYPHPDDLVSRIGPRLDLIASNDPAGKLQNFVLHAPDGRWRMRKHLLPIAAAYDYVLIDTQGAVGALQDAAVLTADRLLSPIATELLSAQEFIRGTIGMLNRLASMADIGLPTGPLVAILYRMDRTRDAREIAQVMRAEAAGWGDAPPPGATSPGPRLSIADQSIPQSVIWREAFSAGVPVHRYAPRSSSAQALVALARALFPHLDFAAFTVEEA